MTDLRKAAEAATPGPWKTHLIDDTTIVSDRVDVATTCDSSNVERSDSYNNDFERMEADAAYIAAANPQAILALLDERDALTARVAALEAENEKLAAALNWYGENARLCRLIHSEGDAGRHALADDGGRRAAAARGKE
jgi:hypothetical protein